MKTKPLKIGYITNFNSFPPLSGGPIHAYHLIENLTKLGHEIHVFDYEQNPKCIKYPRSFFGYLKMSAAVDIFYIRIDGGPDNDRIAMHPAIQAPGEPIVWEINAPIEEQLMYIAQFPHNPPYDPRYTIDLADLAKYQQIRKRAARHVRAAICVSRPLAAYALEELRIPQAYYVPNGSDPNVFSPEKRDETIWPQLKNKVKVLWAGSSQYRWHNFPLIYRAARLLERDERIVFLIMGNKDFIHIPRQKNIILLEPVEFSELPRRIASSDICLALFRPWQRFNLDCYFSPLKLFDFMACARPTIASDMGEISKIVDNGKDGFLISNEPDELARYIKLLADDKKLGEKIGAAARKKITKFYNWGRAAQQTENAFYDIMQTAT